MRGKPEQIESLLQAALKGYQALELVRSAREGRVKFSDEGDAVPRPDLFAD